MAEALRHVQPRLLTDKEAADYLRLPVSAFVRTGIGRVRLGQYVRYDLRALDAYLDELTGLTAHSAPQPDNDAEAALARFTNGRADVPRRS